jgi:beta-carotene 3-hydroxylase
VFDPLRSVGVAVSPFVLRALTWVPVALVVAVAMDFWAAILHGRLWHARLWPVHRSHHEPPSGAGRLEANDALSLLHAPIAIALIVVGCRGTPGVLREIAFGAGIGMSLFGVAYFVVHDGLVHARLPVHGLLRFRYFRAVARAHRAHHEAAGGAPYGFFFGQWELARAQGISRSRSSTGRARSSSGPRR